MNLQSQQANNTLSNNSVEYDITKDPAKRKCYHCQQEGHYAKFFPMEESTITPWKWLESDHYGVASSNS